MIADSERQLPPSDRSEGMEVAPRHSTATFGDGRNKIAGDVVNSATAELPDNQRSAIRRLHSLYMDEDMSLSEIGDAIGISPSTISTVFRGKYNAKLDNFVADVEAFFKLRDKRAAVKKIPYVHTHMAQQIWLTCASALEYQKINLIFGESHIGKTEPLKEYRRTHNHGETIYVSAPTGGMMIHFLPKLAEVLRIPATLKSCDLRRRIINSFDSRMLLIVDEAHQFLPLNKSTTSRSLQSVEFLRELHDETECGLVICATNLFRDAMDTGEYEKILAQTKRRTLNRLQLPDVPKLKDLNMFAAEFGLPPAFGEALDLQKRLCENESLGTWLTLLRMGNALAVAAKKKCEWAHVLSAYGDKLTLGKVK